MNTWYAPLARAIIALVVAVIVTFSADHSPTLGLVLFGSFAAASGLIIAGFALRGAASIVRTIQVAQGIATAVAGIVALALTSAGLPFLIFIVAAFAVVAGFLELMLGVRSRRRLSAAKDWIFAGGLTVLLAIVVLLVPPDFVQSFTGPDGVQRALTASVIVVGSLGAYWAILGIYLVIAALSLKWAPEITATPNEA